MAQAYITTYVVRGDGLFPLDMLRYDGAYPHRQQDVNAIAGLVTRNVELQSVNARKGWLPEGGRWQSFGWEVVEIKEGRRL